MDVVIETLVKVANDPENFEQKHADTAGNLYHKMLSGKFVVAIVSLKTYLSELYFLNKELQAEDINWTDVQYELRRTRKALQNISDDTLFASAQKLSETIGIPLSLTSFPIHHTRSNAVNANTESVKKSIHTFNENLKVKLNEEFAIRFDEKNIEVMKMFKAFDPSTGSYLDVEFL